MFNLCKENSYYGFNNIFTGLYLCQKGTILDVIHCLPHRLVMWRMVLKKYISNIQKVNLYINTRYQHCTILRMVLKRYISIIQKVNLYIF